MIPYTTTGEGLSRQIQRPPPSGVRPLREASARAGERLLTALLWFASLAAMLAMPVPVKSMDPNEDVEDWVHDGPRRVLEHPGDRLAKPFSGDLKTYVFNATGCLISHRKRGDQDTEKMLWASGPEGLTEEAIVMGTKFLLGEVELDVDNVTKEDTERKDIMAAQLARKFPGDFNQTHCSQKRGHSQLTRGTDQKHQRGQRPPSAP